MMTMHDFVVLFIRRIQEQQAIIGLKAEQLDNVQQQVATLAEALEHLLELGRKDHSNPKYDGYYETARAALASVRGEQKHG